MYICVLTIPSTTAYGFDGVTEEQFELFHSNIDEILAPTDLVYDEEINEGTDSACFLWADSDFYCFNSSAIGNEFDALDEGDEVVDISEEFFEKVQCGYDLFVELTPEIKKEIVATVNKILAPYTLSEAA